MTFDAEGLNNVRPGWNEIPENFSMPFKYIYNSEDGEVTGELIGVAAWDETQTSENAPRMKWSLTVPVERGEGKSTTIDFKLKNYEINGYSFVYTNSTGEAGVEDGSASSVILNTGSGHYGDETNKHYFTNLYKIMHTVTYTDGVEDSEVFADQSYAVAVNDPTPTFDGTPARENYTFTGWDPEVAETVTGNATYTAQWQENTFTVTWLDGYNEAAVKSAKYGVVTKLEEYHNEYPADPSRSGYTFTGWSDPMVDDNGNITITAQWSLNSTPTTYYSLTINYVDGEGNVVADRYTTRQASGYRYSVTSPVVEGMTPDQATVSGILTGNTTLTVTYSEDLDEPDTPTTESPEPTESPEVTETPAPTESPEESEDLGDNDTPLTELPEETETPEPTESQEPDEGEDLDDNDTPLAEVPQTGDMLWLWMTLAAGSAVSLAWISAEEKKGKRVSK
ncbi:MAG: hypothetical protein J6J87_01955 [Oscillospiraceae bacterium]|nr:hypothetical protein [Oscillospiraceae bacterium]